MPITQRLKASAMQVVTGLRGGMRRFASRAPIGAPADAVMLRDKSKPLSPEKRHALLDERAQIHADFREAARLGFVADAHIHRLHANHAEELDESRRELRQLEQGLIASLRRLAALFPPPPAPQPEPTPPPPARHYARPSSMFAQARPVARPGARH